LAKNIGLIIAPLAPLTSLIRPSTTPLWANVAVPKGDKLAKFFNHSWKLLTHCQFPFPIFPDGHQATLAGRCGGWAEGWQSGRGREMETLTETQLAISICSNTESANSLQFAGCRGTRGFRGARCGALKWVVLWAHRQGQLISSLQRRTTSLFNLCSLESQLHAADRNMLHCISKLLFLMGCTARKG